MVCAHYIRPLAYKSSLKIFSRQIKFWKLYENGTGCHVHVPIDTVENPTLSSEHKPQEFIYKKKSLNNVTDGVN